MNINHPDAPKARRAKWWDILILLLGVVVGVSGILILDPINKRVDATQNSSTSRHEAANLCELVDKGVVERIIGPGWDEESDSYVPADQSYTRKIKCTFRVGSGAHGLVNIEANFGRNAVVSMLAVPREQCLDVVGLAMEYGEGFICGSGDTELGHGAPFMNIGWGMQTDYSAFIGFSPSEAGQYHDYEDLRAIARSMQKNLDVSSFIAT